MYRSIYNYTATEKGCLSLKVGQLLMFLEQHDANWWRMQSESGAVGLVPSCYLEPDVKEMQDPAARRVVMESIERAIDVIHSQAAMNSGKYTPEQKANLKKLLDHRKAILSEAKSPGIRASSSKRQAPSKPGNAPIHPHRPAPSLPGMSTKESSPLPGYDRKRSPRREAPCVPKTKSVSPEKNFDEPLPARFAADLLEQLRINTGISYDTSFAAAETVISHIREKVPSTAGLMGRMLQELWAEQGTSDHSDESLLITHDGQGIENILRALTEHKDDAQQRSWALDMDEPIITKQLNDLLTLLSDARRSVSRAVIRQEEYGHLESLVVYFQMEHRRSLRLLLLKVFGSLCRVDQGVIPELLCSVLPGELASSMQTYPDDLELQLSCCLILTMIFSTAEPVPYWLYDQLDSDFVNYVVQCVEEAPEGEDGDKIIESFVHLLLAFNQHFTDPKTNIVMNVLSELYSAKTVSEQLMLLVNREEDPVVMFDYPKSCANSVFKIFTDLFSSPSTSGLFFTADMKVLIEIVLRQLTDLSPGEKVRTEYLALLELMLTNSDYGSHQHMCSDLRACLQRIRDEEAPESQQDKTIVKNILDKFPQYFS
ncbi:NCK-interacting protein with SH3 domain [Nematostella vectensis]|uniref:NCK-interacting protein with SH3 domain n=1 Tax=Nematostella vectensis TaxID=45351 RepID=UPI0020773704|nr:NCK-interacting protein with SH3 domain [Nematostella vectensis]